MKKALFKMSKVPTIEMPLAPTSLAVRWKCPSCDKMNKTIVYMEIEDITFECNYCGKIFIKKK